MTGAGAGADGGTGVGAGADEISEVDIISTLVTGIGKANYKHTYGLTCPVLKHRI
tara:strand:+ start:1667 stop:1831 length:165 start_codon:yes stop_codon:yes gene_type:complete